jgi:hypothetical protein
VADPGPAHCKALIRTLLFIRDTASQPLTFKPGPKPLDVYVDASWAAKHSISGAVFYFLGCPIAWISRTQIAVSLSSAEAEYYAAMTAARDALHYRDLAADFGYMQKGPTCMHFDSKSAIDMSVDPVAFKKTKHIMRAAHFLRDLVARRFIVLSKIAGEDNVADLLTKPVSLPVFRKLSQVLTGCAEL